MSDSLWPYGLQHARFPVLHYLQKFVQIHVQWVSDTIQLSHPLMPPYPPILNLSQHQGLFQSALRIRWPKYWSFSISPSNEYLGLISFRIDWLDRPAVQGTLKSSPRPQFKSINFLALSFLHSPVLTSTPDYWKNHSFDYMDLCQQSNVFAF